jgi:hypothetical protein
MEIGPFRLVPNSDGKLRELEGAWNEYANVIFSACRLFLSRMPSHSRTLAS